MEEQSAKDYNSAAQECGANSDAVTKQMFETLVGDEEDTLRPVRTPDGPHQAFRPQLPGAAVLRRAKRSRTFERVARRRDGFIFARALALILRRPSASLRQPSRRETRAPPSRSSARCAISGSVNSSEGAGACTSSSTAGARLAEADGLCFLSIVPSRLIEPRSETGIPGRTARREKPSAAPWRTRAGGLGFVDRRVAYRYLHFSDPNSAPVAARSQGGASERPQPVTHPDVTVFEYAEVPAALYACTRYR